MLKNKKGTYLVQYTGKRKGTYQLFVTLAGQPIKGSPFSLTIGNPAYGPNCTAEGEGLSIARLDQPATFLIRTYDVDGEPCLGGGQKFAVQVVDAGRNTTTGSVKDNLDGTYEASYTILFEGMFTIRVIELNLILKLSKNYFLKKYIIYL